MFNKQKVSDFRGDFQSAVKELEKKYGVQISLGTIRFDANELRGKMTARVGNPVVKTSTKNDFNIGDLIKINHKKVSSTRTFRITKVMHKNLKVVDVDNSYQVFTVSPGLAQKA